MAGKGGPRQGAGRPKGIHTTHKATVEREQLAARIQAELAGRKPTSKLGREALDELLQLTLGLTAYYQPVLRGQATPADREPNEEKFLTYLKLAKDCASEVANYQSPKFKAVAISIENAPGGPVAPATGEAPGMRVISAQESYKMLRDGDLIDLKVNKPATAAPVAAKKRGAA